MSDILRMIRKIPRAYGFFALTVLLFCALFTAVEVLNGKFWTNDLKVYYEAQRDFFSGKNPYVRHYGLNTGFFKYPPFTLYLFSFFCLVPYWVTQFLHLAMLAASFIISVPLLKSLAEKVYGENSGRKSAWILYLVFFMMAIHLTREFHLGNVNLILLLLFTLGLQGAFSGNDLRAAVLWSLMAVLKPIMILAFVPLLFWKKWKLIGCLSGFGIFFFLFPTLHIGWKGDLSLWGAWLRSIGKHGEYIVSENSLTYMAEHYFGIVSAWWPSVIVFLVLLFMMLAEIFRQGADGKSFVKWTVIFTALAPNFFVTDTEHFLLSAPLLVLLLYRLSQQGRVRHWVLFFAGLLLFSFHSRDLLGKELSFFLDAQATLGIGNLVFIGCFAWLTYGDKARSMQD